MLSKLKYALLNRNNLLERPIPDVTGNDANALLSNALASGEPCMIARYGAYELAVAIAAKSPVNVHNIGRVIAGKSNVLGWNNELARRFCHNAGFFPNRRSDIIKYADLLINDTEQCNILGSWLANEKQLPHVGAKTNYTTVRRIDLEPFYYDNPYTLQLAGKRVLVIHPYRDSILHQWSVRDKLFGGKTVMPECNLSVIKAVQSIAGNQTEFESWFDALDHMKHQMDSSSYDVALIGCGAYGFHLAAHARRTGHQAIHLGGCLQLLFGITGHRWDGEHKFINDNWIRPLPVDIPPGASTIEDGCYW